MIVKYGNIRINGMPVFGGTGAPSGTLGGELKDAVALYLRHNASTADTVMYATVDTGTTWAAYNNGAIAAMTDGTVTITAASGSVSETGLVNLDLTGSGTMTLAGGGVSQFGDDTAKIRFDGAGATSLTGVTTLDLDAAGAASLESSAGVINIGADAVAQGVNIATGAAARPILIGNAASASLGLEGGIGALSLTSDTLIDINAPSIDLSTQATSIGMIDNSGTAFAIKEGSTNYMIFSTVNGTEKIQVPQTIELGTVNEVVNNTGVTIDGVTLKDDGIQSLVLGDYVNDAAAAIGGVAVGQLYRNGSVVMIRVA